MFSEEYCFTGTTPFYKMKKSSSNFKTVSSLTNPEVFVTTPKCGDYLENTISSASAAYIHVNQPLKSHSNLPNIPVQNYISFASLKVPKTNATKSRLPYSRENHIKYTEEEENGYKTIKDPMKAENYEALLNNMLAVTVSCVMLMASKAENIPDEYLMWAEYYLTCIKDENKKHPPNVQGILNHIKYLRKNYLLKNHLNRRSDVYSSPLKNPNINGTPKSLSAERLTPVVNYTAKQTQQKILKPIFIKQKTIVNL